MGYPVHPYAAQFPLLDDDELMELAASIRTYGQDKPIMLDHTGELLVDGRNRDRACKIAGVEPRFERLPEGTDLVAYIIRANIEHRHLNAGQRAVALALAHPEPGKAGRRKNGSDSEQLPVSRAYLSNAREIVAHQDLAEQVMSKAVSFDYALGEARWRVANAGTAKRHQRELQNEAPELAEKVVAGEMSLYSAVMELTRRQKAAAADDRKQVGSALELLGGFVAAWKNGLDLRKNEAFRAGLIDRFGVEPADVPKMLADLDRAIGRTS